MHAFGGVLAPLALAASRSSWLFVSSTHSLTMMGPGCLMSHGSLVTVSHSLCSPLISDLNTDLDLLFRERETRNTLGTSALTISPRKVVPLLLCLGPG